MNGLETKQEVKTARPLLGWVSCQSCEDDKKGTRPCGRESADKKEKNRDVVQIAPPVKLTKGGKENDARLDDYSQRIDLS